VNESRKTAAAIGVALVMTLLAWVTVPRSSTPGAFEDRGTTFFPGFNDPTMAQSLEVIDFDEETATAHPFKVQVQNGLWSIPSHYNYPADAEQQLSQISAAIIALKKDVVAADNVSEQERTRTLDPLDETLPAIRGRGTRVIIKGGNDRLLADIIIGKALEGRPTFRYVRLSDQRRIYVAAVGDLNISTNFGDWIDRDLLKIVWDDVDEVIIRDYSLDEAARSINNRDAIFIRKIQDEPPQWTLRDIQQGQHVNTFNMNLLVTTLDQLEIMGVRPKPPTIAASLSKMTSTIRISDDGLKELASKGFYLTSKGQFSNEGEVLVHTKAGLFYTLRFGEIAYGDIGDITPTATTAASTRPAAAAGQKPGGPQAPGTAKPATPPLGSPNRYLTITASFDPTGVPAGPQRTITEQRAAALQARYAPWYYVISGQAFERIRLSRHMLLGSEKVK
jgi:uncharacterized protein DUF4340